MDEPRRGAARKTITLLRGQPRPSGAGEEKSPAVCVQRSGRGYKGGAGEEFIDVKDLQPCLCAPRIVSLDKRLIRGWLGSNERIVPTVPTGPHRICRLSKRLQQPSLRSEIYIALMLMTRRSISSDYGLCRALLNPMTLLVCGSFGQPAHLSGQC